MKQNRVDAVLKNLDAMGLSQVLITDPLSIFYLTGRMIYPLERFYALYLNQNGTHRIFINQLETVPEDLGVEKVRFSDTDPYLDLVFQVRCGENIRLRIMEDIGHHCNSSFNGVIESPSFRLN